MMMARVGGSYGADFKGVPRSDAGRSALPHHIQCGGGCVGTALVDGDGGGSGRVGRVWKRG